MGFLQTRLGDFVKSVSKLSVNKIEREAYNDSVLVQMADLNTEKQLNADGVFADGSDTPDYSPFTKSIKASKGQPYAHMTFKDTGETQSSIVYRFSTELLATWNDQYDLQAKYGQIVGLTDDSIAEIQPEIIENIQDFILSKL